MAARWGLRTLLQLGVERLDDFIFLLQRLTKPARAHKDKNQLWHSELKERKQVCLLKTV